MGKLRVSGDEIVAVIGGGGDELVGISDDLSTTDKLVSAGDATGGDNSAGEMLGFIRVNTEAGFGITMVAVVVAGVAGENTVVAGATEDTDIVGIDGVSVAEGIVGDFLKVGDDVCGCCVAKIGVSSSLAGCTVGCV